MLKGITSQQPVVEMSNNQHFVGGDGGRRHLFIPMSGIFDHKLTILINELCYSVCSVMVIILLQPLELISVRTEDETRIRITVRLVGDLAQGDAHYIQFFNILVRKCLGHLNLQLVGRNFFDAKAKVFHLCALIFIFSFLT